MDMNGPLTYGQPSFANQQVMKPQTPDYLKQDPTNGTVPGAMSNMVKALVDGNNKFQQQRVPPNVGSATSYTAPQAPGAPMSLAPPAPGMQPNQGMAGLGDTSGAFPGGALPGMPNGIDPTMSALFSNIPGQ